MWLARWRATVVHGASLLHLSSPLGWESTLAIVPRSARRSACSACSSHPIGACSSRLLKNSPFASLECRFVAEMEANFAVDRTIIVEFGPSISEDGVHLVGALPREVDGIGEEGAIEVTDHTSELELTTPAGLELDTGGLDHV